MLKQIMNTVDKSLTLFEDWTLFLTVITALIALFANVILRYGFNYTLAWSEEYVKLVIIYTTFIGCSASVKNRSMIKVDVLLQLVPDNPVPADFIQPSGNHRVFDDHGVLRLEDGRSAGLHRPDDHHYADPHGLPVRIDAAHGRPDADPYPPGAISGYCRRKAAKIKGLKSTETNGFQLNFVF